jgi:hypothetical protein
MLRSLRHRLQIATCGGLGVGLFAALLLVPACSQERPTTFTPDFDTGPIDYPDAVEFVEAVGSDVAGSTFVDESFPAPTGGSAPSLLGARQYVGGGSFVVLVTPSASATELLVGVRKSDPGYWTIDLSSMPKRLDGSILVTVTPNNQSPDTTIRMMIAETDGNTISNVSYHNSIRNSTAVSSQYLQVSLNWLHAVDYDLHLEVPEGDDICWVARTGGNGGSLDLDSNAGCTIDNIDNENITWGSTVPTAGNYTIRVNLWSSCVPTEALPFLLVWTINGVSEVYVGEMLPSDAYTGGAFDGTIITSFSYPGP